MRCERIQERFSCYLLGEMGSAEKKVLEDHLAGCETCRLQFEQMEVVWRSLGDLPES